MPVPRRNVNGVSFEIRINDEIDFAWQGQYLVKLQGHSSWQAQYLFEVRG